MDRIPDNKKRETTSKNNRNNYDLMMQIIDEGHKETIAAIDESLKSRLLWGKNRTFLIMFKALLDMATLNSKQSVYNFFSTVDIQKRLFRLETIIQEIAMNTDVNLSNIKSEIAMLKKHTVPKPYDQYLDEVRKWYESIKDFTDMYLERRK